MAPYGLLDKNGRTGVPLEKIQVRGSLVGFTAEVTATMEYINNQDNPIEAIYVFPLDEEAAVCGFQATVDGRTIIAEVQEKQEARDTYDDAISSGHSAYLLEESDESSDIFQVNVGNLPPKKAATVEITFVTELRVEKEGRVVFVLPTVLNPRYTPSDSRESVSTTLPSIASASTKYAFDFELRVQCASAIQEITSPCHRLKVEINPNDHRRARVRLDEEYQFRHDIQVQVLTSKPFEPSVILEDCVTADWKEEKDFMSKPVVMLNFFPEFDSSADLERGEFIFVVDRSGSMGGSRMKCAKETLLLFLKSLPEDCYFNVIGFGSSFQKLFQKSEVYSDSTVDVACSHAQSMEADLGGTEILRPLKDVFSQPLIKGYPRQVFLLTDGEVGNTQQVIELTRKNANKARCFAFGIGSGASTALVKGVAKAGRGKADFVVSTDKMQAKVIKMLKNALQPVLLDCRVTWDLPKGYSADSVPDPLPSIFSGESLVLYGFLSFSSAKKKPSVEKELVGSMTFTATLTTPSGNESVKHKVSFLGLSSESGENKLLHRLAAKASIQAKQHQEEEEGDFIRDEEKERIIRLSKSANVISKLTSFVAVDKESHEPVSRPMTRPQHSETRLLMSAVSCSLNGSRKAKSASGLAMGRLFTARKGSRLKMRSKRTGFSFQPQSLPNSVFAAEASLKLATVYDSLPYPAGSGGPPPPAPAPASLNSATVYDSMPYPAGSGGPPPPPPPDVLCEYDPTIENDVCYDDIGLDSYIRDSDEDADAFARKTPSQRSEGSNFLQLVSLQRASGSWQLTAQLASICGLTMDKLKKDCPTDLTADNKESVWATALALSCLFSRFKDKRDEWEMVAAKGTKWLNKNINNQTLSYDKLMEMAANALANAAD